MLTEHPHEPATTPRELDTLPRTISHVGDAIDELARRVITLSDTVAASSALGDVGPDLDHLPAEERALSWHLHELAARLRAARASAETARHWARELDGRIRPR
jgi:hypothetical protein